MKKRDALIAELSRDLSPVKRAPNINLVAMIWFLSSAFYVVVMTGFFDPVRPGAFDQLSSSFRFLFETLLGIAALVWLSLLAFRAAVPGALTRWFMAGGFLLLGVWLFQYVIGLVSPALDPSMFGKRSHCFFETMVYALPPILAGLYFIRRLYPLRPVRTAMWISLAAGMLPALHMQIACMYEPEHILTMHILPGLLMVIVGALIAAVWPGRYQAKY